MDEITTLPNGHTLYRQANGAGGHSYWSTEIGYDGGICVWDTCLVDEATLLAAIVEEHRRTTQERHAREIAEREHKNNG